MFFIPHQLPSSWWICTWFVFNCLNNFLFLFFKCKSEALGHSRTERVMTHLSLSSPAKPGLCFSACLQTLEIAVGFSFHSEHPVLWLQPPCLAVSLPCMPGLRGSRVWGRDLHRQRSPPRTPAPGKHSPRPFLLHALKLSGSGQGKVASAFHGPLGFAEPSGSREASSTGSLQKGAGEQLGLGCGWRVFSVLLGCKTGKVSKQPSMY